MESYEKINGPIDEKSESGQEVLRGFLKISDPEKKEVLKQQIKKKGQRQPAIITCDGFLINGNRRKMVFEGNIPIWVTREYVSMCKLRDNEKSYPKNQDLTFIKHNTIVFVIK